MKHMFLDTNVLIDHFDRKRPNHSASSAILRLLASGKAKGIITPTALLDTIYVLRKALTPAQAAQYLKDMLSAMELAEVGRAELLAAADMGWKDIEDAVQYQAAIAFGKTDLFVTGDHGFEALGPIPIIDPRSALEVLIPIRTTDPPDLLALFPHHFSEEVVP